MLLLLLPLYFCINAHLIFIISGYNCGNIVIHWMAMHLNNRFYWLQKRKCVPLCVLVCMCVSICLWLLFSLLGLNVIIQALVLHFPCHFNGVWVYVCAFSVNVNLSKCACIRVCVCERVCPLMHDKMSHLTLLLFKRNEAYIFAIYYMYMCGYTCVCVCVRLFVRTLA